MNRSVIAVGGVLTLAAGACSGDDDATETSPVETVASTAPPTSESTTTTSRSIPISTTTSTTVAPPTSLTDDELRVRIVADYERAAERLDVLTSNPTLENLDARLAEIAAPGSPASESITEFITGIVERGERVINGDPDYSSVQVTALLTAAGLVLDGGRQLEACRHADQAAAAAGRAAIQMEGAEAFGNRLHAPAAITRGQAELAAGGITGTVRETATANPSQGVIAGTPDAPRRNP